MEDMRKQALQKIPAVDLVLKYLENEGHGDQYPRPLLAEGVRRAAHDLRRALLRRGEGETGDLDCSVESLAQKARSYVQAWTTRKLKRVINATGTILHTNLGRALLAREALEAVADVAGNYSNLEYDLSRGERGERYDHVQELLCRLTGAEKALVVNNNAAAVLLALSTLAKGREVLVSRGELVEIGGSFRIPAVMALSGARLVEVGTTNRTRLEDYRRGLTPETALLMKVHTSNYRVVGFTEETFLEELAALGEECGLPLMEDLGSGVLYDLSPYGMGEEPAVGARVAAGASVVTFSGDKLLGGPQAGIIVGRREYVEAMGKNQLTRALRIDKMTLAALESTLLLYMKGEEVLRRIPTLAMLTVSAGELEALARELSGELRRCLQDTARVDVLEDVSAVGGGALPLARIPTWVVSVSLPGMSANGMAEKLRQGDPPLIVRVQQDRILLDPRTLQPGDRDRIPPLIKGILDHR